MDYEEMILARQDDADFGIGDSCACCPYSLYDLCENQCMEIEEHWNPNLKGENKWY